MNSQSHFDRVMVAVAPEGGPDGAALLERLKRFAANTAARTGEARVLGPHAAELALPGLQAEAAEVIRTALKAASDRFDSALLPAANRRKRLLISDMDSTIIGQECIDELADYAGIKPQIAEITERAMRGELDFEEALKTRVALLKGLPLTVLETCWQERIRLNPGSGVLVRTMAAAGARCVLVSGGFTAFTGRVAREAGFHADQANQLIDDGKALTGAVREPILGRAAKREALERECATKGLVPDDALALGDGANDLDMIRAAGLGVAYRAKPVVAAEAHAAIALTDLRTVLYFQGYSDAEFVDPKAP